jgi:type IV pilus assembly protein PilX
VTSRLRCHRRGRIAFRRQRGIVLFIALIVMVAMTLAAIALIRSVDTTNTAVGNLAFRQSSILPANFAVERAAASLFADVNNGKITLIADLTKDDLTHNYYATYRRTDNKIGVPADLQTKTLAGPTGNLKAPQFTDNADNVITYVIERMCDDKSAVKPGDGIASLTWCDMMPPKQNPGTTVNDPELIKFPPVPIYRVTVRVDGPKNTASFLQADLR